MFETISKHRHMCLQWLMVFTYVLNPIYLSLSCRDFGGDFEPATAFSISMEPNSPAENESLTDTERRAQSAALRAATRMATTGFRPSLEMKENVDFLLTPAMLTQEVLSDEIITTYPSE